MKNAKMSQTKTSRAASPRVSLLKLHFAIPKHYLPQKLTLQSSIALNCANTISATSCITYLVHKKKITL